MNTQHSAGAAGESLNIYPVPASSAITVSFSSDANENAPMSIINVLGEKVFSEVTAVSPGVNLMRIDLSKFSNGIYFCEIISNGVALCKQFVIQK